MYSKRFRDKIKERKGLPDWFVFACWRENIRHYPCNNPLFNKYIGE